MVKTVFGQIIIGPPGSGKTSYCEVMEKLLKELGRQVAIVNIDPANECRKYEALIDLSELISLEDVMENMRLGPNGALIYCMEFLEKNIHWLKKKISDLKNYYFLFDCPGQIELYTHYSSVKNIFQQIQRDLDLHLCVIHLVDSHYCNNAGKFISTIFMTLSTMLQLEMPLINVLSKIDLANKYSDKLRFNIDFYTEVLNMNYLLESLDEDTFTKKYSKLNEAIISLVEDYSLVSFIPLNITNRKSLLKILREADKANGYIFGVGEDKNVQALLASAAGVEYEDETLKIFDGVKQNSVKKVNLSDELLWK